MNPLILRDAVRGARDAGRWLTGEVQAWSRDRGRSCALGGCVNPCCPRRGALLSRGKKPEGRKERAMIIFRSFIAAFFVVALGGPAWAATLTTPVLGAGS